MSKPAAFEADYFNFEYKKGLKVCRLTFEVPYEHAKLVRDVLGDPPLPGEQVRVGIARLNGAAVPEKKEPVSEPEKATGGAVEPRKLTRTQIAALRVKDPEFQHWFCATYRDELASFDDDGDDADFTNRALKWFLNIQSKKEIDSNPSVGEAWQKILTSFDYRNQVRA